MERYGLSVWKNGGNLWAIPNSMWRGPHAYRIETLLTTTNTRQREQGVALTGRNTTGPPSRAAHW